MLPLVDDPVQGVPEMSNWTFGGTVHIALHWAHQAVMLRDMDSINAFLSRNCRC